jgi:hypothetical protein
MGMLHMGELVKRSEESFTAEYAMSFNVQVALGHPDGYIFRERRGHIAFKQIIQMIPNLEECLKNGSKDDILLISDLVCSIFGR